MRVALVIQHATRMRRIILSVARVISGFRREVDNIRTALGYYTAYRGNSLPMFGDNLSVSSSWVKNPMSLFRNVCRELLRIPKER